MRSAISSPYSLRHLARIHSGIENRISWEGNWIPSFSLEIVLNTPFTKPERLPNFRFFASFTASFIAAESGTRSI